MTNQIFKLPPRKWYTLEQAIKRIKQLTGEELEIVDLIHYWLSNKLELCVNIFYNPLTLSVGSLNIDTKDLIFLNVTSLDNETFHYEFDNLLTITDLIKEHEDLETRKLFSESSLEVLKKIDSSFLDYEERQKVIIMGILSIYPIEKIFNEKEIAENGFSFLDIKNFVTPTVKNKERLLIDMFVFNPEKPEEEQILPLDDFIVLDVDLMNFLQEKTEIEEIKGKINQVKTPHPKTLNAQAEFLRNLIITQYGEDYANNIRRELDNPSSEIRQDFEKKGLPTPSGKAVDRWINQP